MAQRTQTPPLWEVPTAQATCRFCLTAFTPVKRQHVFCSGPCRITWLNNQRSPYGAGRKLCATCRVTKDTLRDFPIGERLCHECLRLRDAEHKVCSYCKEAKPFADFYSGRDRNGLAAICRPCTSEKSRRRNADLQVRQRSRARKLVERYGITVEDYERLLDEQGHACRLCGRPHDPDGKPLAVDHCHATGAVRGLLCTLCNSAIGYFEEDPIRMANAIAYLEGRYPHASQDLRA